MPSLSIITPTWNRADHLPDLFDSVRSLAPPPYEHILVDNCSTDATASRIADYAAGAPWPVRHLCNGDSGLYDAMNQGARAASGDALYFLNDDDRLIPDGLFFLLQLLKRTGADVAFGDVWREDPANGRRSLRRHRQMNFLTLAERSICQQATLYRRSSWEAVDPFDASLRYGADYDWMLRALRSNHLRASYGAWPVAIFSLGGLTSNADHAVAFAEEMESIRARYYSPEDRRRATRFRRLWRKWPWGFSLAGKSSDRFRVQAFMRIGSLTLPDPRAVLEL